VVNLSRTRVGLPHRAGAGFMLAGAAAAVAALVLPGYIRPGGYRTLVVVLAVAVLVDAAVSFWGPRVGDGPLVATVLISNVIIVAAQNCVNRSFDPVGFVMFSLPTMFTALFLPRWVFTRLQAPAALAGIVATFWLWGERGSILVLHSSIAIVGVVSPAVALLVLRRQLEVALSAARDLAGTDPLTGLANRRALASRAAVVAAHAHRESVEVCLVTLDLDNFKRINDTYGHRAGDAVLQRLSASLRAHTRAIDVIARIGGDEFVIFAAMSADVGLALADRIREQIALDFTDVGMTASLGLATSLPPTRADDVEPALWAMVDRADDFMYVAKELGRNRVVSARVPAAVTGRATLHTVARDVAGVD
jgi:diguanylate cyclase (GGDEF)-like protein